MRVLPLPPKSTSISESKKDKLLFHHTEKIVQAKTLSWFWRIFK